MAPDLFGGGRPQDLHLNLRTSFYIFLGLIVYVLHEPFPMRTITRSLALHEERACLHAEGHCAYPFNSFECSKASARILYKQLRKIKLILVPIKSA
jgi:hypothetical protein